jgi:hypothetical protein
VLMQGSLGRTIGALFHRNALLAQRHIIEPLVLPLRKLTQMTESPDERFTTLEIGTVGESELAICIENIHRLVHHQNVDFTSILEPLEPCMRVECKHPSTTSTSSYTVLLLTNVRAQFARFYSNCTASHARPTPTSRARCWRFCSKSSRSP